MMTPELFELLLMFEGKLVELCPEDFYQGEIEMPKPELRRLQFYGGETLWFGENDGMGEMTQVLDLANESRMKTHSLVADIEVCIELFNRESIDISGINTKKPPSIFGVKKTEEPKPSYQLLSAAGYLICQFEYRWELTLFANWLVFSDVWDLDSEWTNSSYAEFQNLLTKFRYNIFPLVRLLPRQFQRLMYWQRV